MIYRKTSQHSTTQREAVCRACCLVKVPSAQAIGLFVEVPSAQVIGPLVEVPPSQVIGLIVEVPSQVICPLPL